MAGFLADPELFAQIGYGETPDPYECDETIAFFKWSFVFQGKAPLCVTHIPGQSFADLPCLNLGHFHA